MTLSTLFLICFLVGLGVSAVSLFSSFLHLHHGGFHFHHHGGGGGHSLVKNSSELFGSLFNLAAITMFLAWFGGVGLLLETTRLAAGGVVVIAGGAGLTGAAAIVRIVRALRMREHPLQPIQLVGTIGKLTIPIREGGTGEIVYTVDGTRRCSGARSDDSKRPIARDTEVVITRYDKGIAYVCEFDRMIAR
ncbi:MAG TPA: hypothetical protein VEO74_17340 [Thermoanaerobaculia bacterium]|nr:hypothetical protein [Thermoanaerobaculia bacterium]